MIGAQMLLLAVRCEDLGGIPIRIQRHEHEVHLIANPGREGVLNALQVVDNEGTGEFAMGEEQRHNLWTPTKNTQRDIAAHIGYPHRINLVERLIRRWRHYRQLPATRRPICGDVD